MVKVVINVCFGGYGLSYKALKRICDIQGKKIYAFKSKYNSDYSQTTYEPISIEESERTFNVSYFSVENPNDYTKMEKSWCDMTMDEKDAHNKKFNDIYVSSYMFNDDRTNPLLIQVVEELGHEADGSCAELKIVEIPDGVDYEIDEYDGNETIDEVHRSWR